MTPPADLHHRIKLAIIASICTSEMAPEDIGDDVVLFGSEGLGLDSIDALELAFELEEAFGVRLPDDEAQRPIFRSVRTLGAFLVQAGAVGGEVPDSA